MLDSFTGALTAKTVSGDIRGAFVGFVGNIKLNTTSGEMKLTLPESSGFVLDAKSVSGDINCDFPISMTKGGIKNSMQGTVGDGKYKIDMDSVSGDLKIAK